MRKCYRLLGSLKVSDSALYQVPEIFPPGQTAHRFELYFPNYSSAVACHSGVSTRRLWAASLPPAEQQQQGRGRPWHGKWFIKRGNNYDHFSPKFPLTHQHATTTRTVITMIILDQLAEIIIIIIISGGSYGPTHNYIYWPPATIYTPACPAHHIACSRVR